MKNIQVILASLMIAVMANISWGQEREIGWVEGPADQAIERMTPAQTPVITPAESIVKATPTPGVVNSHVYPVPTTCGAPALVAVDSKKVAVAVPKVIYRQGKPIIRYKYVYKTALTKEQAQQVINNALVGVATEETIQKNQRYLIGIYDYIKDPTLGLPAVNGKLDTLLDRTEPQNPWAWLLAILPWIFAILGFILIAGFLLWLLLFLLRTLFGGLSTYGNSGCLGWILGIGKREPPVETKTISNIVRLHRGGRVIGTSEVKIPVSDEYTRMEVEKRWKNLCSGSEWIIGKPRIEDFAQPTDEILFRIIVENKSNRPIPASEIIIEEFPELGEFKFVPGQTTCRINDATCRWILLDSMVEQWLEDGKALSMEVATSVVSIPKYKGMLPARGAWIVDVVLQRRDREADQGYDGELVEAPADIVEKVREREAEAEDEAKRKAEEEAARKAAEEEAKRKAEEAKPDEAELERRKALVEAEAAGLLIALDATQIGQVINTPNFEDSKVPEYVDQILTEEQRAESMEKLALAAI